MSCHCNSSTPVAARCHPPSPPVEEALGVEVGWSCGVDESAGSNWGRCPKRVDTACTLLERTPALYLDGTGRQAPHMGKWREAAGLVGLSAEETEDVLEWKQADLDEERDEREADERMMQQENARVDAFVAAHPWPSYADMCSKMSGYMADGTHPPELRRAVFEWSAEYGEINHALCKEIYENIHDAARCKRVGQRIFDRGGFTALQANFYIVRNFAPTRFSDDHAVRTSSAALQHHFDGIGGWRD
jgi:hypothetical protein